MACGRRRLPPQCLPEPRLGCRQIAPFQRTLTQQAKSLVAIGPRGNDAAGHGLCLGQPPRLEMLAAQGQHLFEGHSCHSYSSHALRITRNNAAASRGGSHNGEPATRSRSRPATPPIAAGPQPVRRPAPRNAQRVLGNGLLKPRVAKRQTVTAGQHGPRPGDQRHAHPEHSQVVRPPEKGNGSRAMSARR